MKNGSKNSLVGKLIRIGKKNKYLKYPVLPVLFVVVAVKDLTLNIRLGLRKNAYRFGSLASVALVFVVCSSFAFEMGEGDVQNMPTVSEDGIAVPVSEGIHMTYDQENVFEEEAGELLTDENSGPETALVSGEDGKVTEADFSEDWKLVLINKSNPIPPDYEFELGSIKGSIKADVRIIDEADAMLRDAKAEGIDLVICSPYRDYDRQVTLFNKKIKNYMKQGMSYMDAYVTASKTVAVPGASEHQIGLALDIVCETHYGLDAEFGETEAGKWLAQNSHKYGFILRYPADKEAVTGIEYEPWHFRYVGDEAAVAIKEQDITLEEYVEQIGLK